ncbi:MAG: cation:dicarboxylase symporter family transporter, partial [Deltaproteobacteria bacterium]|nr:cation:dicarboxylase symporter family transporter [Deltaproteobacteria bacterium]
MSRHLKILIALVGGALCGVALNLALAGSPAGGRALDWSVGHIFEPAGRMWLSALIMVVIPLIVSSLALGVAGLGSFGRLGRIGAVALASFLSLTALSTALGLTMMNAFAPGRSLDPAIKQRLLETYRGQVDGAFGLSGDIFSVDLLVKIVPRNPVRAAADGDMLAVIFCALMIGVALMLVPRDKAEPVSRLLDSIGSITVAIIDLVMKAAPIGVFCLVFSVTARFGYELLFNLFKYVAVVVAGLLLFQTVGYALLLRLVAGFSPRLFFRQAQLALLTAFSTSSSSATLPTTLRVAEENLGLPREIAGFVLPLGATMNMNGTAL